MNLNDLVTAKEYLIKEGCTCVLCKNGQRLISRLRGVQPLIEFYEGNIQPGFCAADKVVGNGAAYMYVLMKITALYAGVISKPAKETLERHNITVEYDRLVENVLNRDNTDICPMEKAVQNASSPEEAYLLMKDRLKQLKQINRS